MALMAATKLLVRLLKMSYGSDRDYLTIKKTASFVINTPPILSLRCAKSSCYLRPYWNWIEDPSFSAILKL